MKHPSRLPLMPHWPEIGHMQIPDTILVRVMALPSEESDLFLTISSEILGYTDGSLDKNGIPLERKDKWMDPEWVTLKWRLHYRSLGLQRNVCLGSYLKGVGGWHSKKDSKFFSTVSTYSRHLRIFVGGTNTYSITLNAKWIIEPCTGSCLLLDQFYCKDLSNLVKFY